MKRTYDSSLTAALVQLIPGRLQRHSYSIVGLAQAIAQEFECPLCEALTPIGEALTELAAQHRIEFDADRKQIVLA